MRKHSPHSMKWKIVMILLVCWLVPFSFLIGVTGFYLGTNYSDMTEANYQSQLEFNNRICMERLDRTIVDSRQASYDGEILDIWKEYQSGRISHILAKKRSNEYLEKTYQQNDAISCVLLWMENEEERLTSSMYNTKSNGTYQGISSFWRKIMKRCVRLRRHWIHPSDSLCVGKSFFSSAT